jgi:hypothetical protein
MMTRIADDELDGLRRAVAARSVGIEADAGQTDALLQRYRRALERRVVDALRRRHPCSADMLGGRCFGMLVRRMIVERRYVITLRQAGEIVSGGWFGQQQELQALPWMGELVRLESALADMNAAPTMRVQVLHFRSDWNVVGLFDWWRTGARGAVPSSAARVTAIIVGRSGRLRIVRLPCIPSVIFGVGRTDFATAPPGG